MSTARGCLICGAEITEAHHPTGRDLQGAYLDPRFTIPLCHDHHLVIHDDWWTLEVQDQTPRNGGRRLTGVERVELRLRRLAIDGGRLAIADPQRGRIARLAECSKRWADELACDIAARDRRDPY